MILLKNGFLVEGDNLLKKDILIENNLIKKIDDNIDFKDALVFDCSSLIYLPGLIDVHVHLREPGYTHKETIKTGTLSASKGGFTTVCCMPNTFPFIDNMNSLNNLIDIINKDSVIKVYPISCITVNQKGEELVDIEKVKDYVCAISDDGVGVNNQKLLDKAIKKAKEFDLLISSHSESLDSNLRDKEINAIKKEIDLVRKNNSRYHFCHVSLKESVDLIRSAKLEGLNVSCEVTPHHLFLNETDIKNASFKMNPPLRTKEDQIALLEGIKDKIIEVVATDHAPHEKESKELEYSLCSNGIIGLETALPLLITNLVKKGIISYSLLIDLLVNNPSRIFNLENNLIKVGSCANLICVDVNTYRTYTEVEILSKSKNSPFIGCELTGFCVLTIYNGKIVYKGDYFNE